MSELRWRQFPFHSLHAVLPAPKPHQNSRAILAPPWELGVWCSSEYCHGLFLVSELPRAVDRSEKRMPDIAMSMIQRLFSKEQLVLNHERNLFPQVRHILCDVLYHTCLSFIKLDVAFSPSASGSMVMRNTPSEKVRNHASTGRH